MRLEITRKTHLAMQAVTALGRAGGKVKGSDLAAEIGTSPGFLAQAVKPLVQRGWLASQPGRTGGYELTPNGAGISVLNVIEAVEGPTDTTSCVLRAGQCSAEAPCATHDAWSRARTALVRELADTPLTSHPIMGAAQ